MTLLLTHPSSHRHVTPEGHPERVERIEAIERALSAPEFDTLVREDAPEGTEADVLTCHRQSHIDAVRDAVPEAGMAGLDPDTFVSPGSWEAAMRGVGGIRRAVDAVMGGEHRNAFLAMRPPGHHAEKTRAMGFCLFGNAAIGARYALDHHGAERVAVVDFDVHHGNGTQDILWDEPRALFLSSHQMPLYPGTGAVAERGATGNIVNMPLGPGTGGDEMRMLYRNRVFPKLRDWDPDLIVISAGFDAHADDPLAGLNWLTEDFAWLTRELCDVADEVCGGRVVSTLEGGYDLQALAASVALHVAGLMERT
ncbi:histone deacetylase family protein [Rhodobacterales bacterium HKCCE2091]|nr:histone deacetylase family protein [Rhodobacterales bacterium HKCCE2091]